LISGCSAKVASEEVKQMALEDVSENLKLYVQMKFRGLGVVVFGAT
jgi:hypothetical protein